MDDFVWQLWPFIMAGMALSLLGAALIGVRLGAVSQETFEALGRPMLGSVLRRGIGSDLNDFIWSGRHQQIGDRLLTVLVWVFRLILITTLVIFVVSVLWSLRFVLAL